MKIKAKDLIERDHVDLEKLGPYGFDKESSYAVAAQAEYGVAYSLEWETDSCVRVDFNNFPSIGLPPEFEVEIDDEQARYVRASHVGG